MATRLNHAQKCKWEDEKKGREEFSEELEKEDDMNKKLCKPSETIATINSNFKNNFTFR